MQCCKKEGQESGLSSMTASKRAFRIGDRLVGDDYPPLVIAEIGIKRVAAVVNKVRDDADKEAVARALDPIPLLGALPYDRQAIDADLSGAPPYPTLDDIPDQARQLLEALRGQMG